MNRFFFIIAALAVAASLASTEHVSVGTWKLNIAKSKGLKPAPQSAVVTITAPGNTRMMETRTVAANGKETHATSEVFTDGKDHPYTGGGPGNYYTHATRETGSNYEQTRTVSAKGVNQQGVVYDTTSVYEKQ